MSKGLGRVQGAILDHLWNRAVVATVDAVAGSEFNALREFVEIAWTRRSRGKLRGPWIDELIGHCPWVPVSELIACQPATKASSVRRATRFLVRDGYLEASRDATDGRNSCVRLLMQDT